MACMGLSESATIVGAAAAIELIEEKAMKIRHPKTTAERKDALGLLADIREEGWEGIVCPSRRVGRDGNGLPSDRDDTFRRPQRTWKSNRRAQYRQAK